MAYLAFGILTIVYFELKGKMTFMSWIKIGCMIKIYEMGMGNKIYAQSKQIKKRCVKRFPEIVA